MKLTEREIREALEQVASRELWPMETLARLARQVLDAERLVTVTDEGGQMMQRVIVDPIEREVKG